MRNLLLFFLVLIQVNLFAQNKDIVIGQIDSIQSEILGESRKLWIHVPQGADKEIFTPERYPVVFLLDGDAFFSSMQGLIQQLSFVNGNTLCPKMIIVGIPNTNRWRDLSPSRPSLGDDPFMNAEMIAQTGGGENFIAFIEKELIPYIDSKYPTEPYKMLVGHSLGGLMAVHTFFHKPELFNAYVAIDPSMSWNKKKLLLEIKKKKLGKKYENRSLYLGIANSDTEEKDSLTIRNDQTPWTEHTRSIFEFHDIMKSQRDKLNYRAKFYPADDHQSIPFNAQYDAFRYIFRSHKFKLTAVDYMFPNSNIAEKLETHYQELSSFFGYEKKPGEDYLNSMAYQFMNMKQYPKAEQLFLLNIKFYPKSFNVYDSIGDLYELKGEREKAIENYKKAIKLNPKSAYTKEKLEELENQ